MTEVKLKPCPFCGGEAEFVNTWNCLCHVICRSCGAEIWGIKKHPNDFRTRDEVIAAWNNRAIDRDELLDIAEDLDCGWAQFNDGTIACEDVDKFEREMATRIRKAVGE